MRSQIDSAIDPYSKGHVAPPKVSRSINKARPLDGIWVHIEPLLPRLDGSVGMLPLHRASSLAFYCLDIVFELLPPS